MRADDGADEAERALRDVLEHSSTDVQRLNAHLVTARRTTSSAQQKTKTTPAERLAAQLHDAGVVGFVTEHLFHPVRRWRFDFAFVAERVAVEVEGGVYSGGRHVRGTGYTEDVVKYNEAALDGWLLVRCTTQHVDDGTALSWIQRALQSRAGGAQSARDQNGCSIYPS